ncbi:IclR family transcriptional regulator [Roseovarius indicus]|uniref:Acetate operon repressor n=2 Tax=Roseovarius indicus TaxID=540747 RepID=A0A0T5P343_9RHOB|nr:IclR family transcriptional regulator C-terminal domain-containing protein [Roseovarius indicus]KRS15520.1 hypothetical protein XM52_23160 [Roseovarius indicus]QEW25289.1 Acetate operon repressor [Roseovarius indicus]SFE20156.1 transcriptional regulator, IclR family [Roseovarius indicus]
MIIRQVKFAFDLLQFMADRQAPATISEIAEHFGWPRSSTVNQVETLCHLGLMHEPVHRQGYLPTSRLLDLASELVRADSRGSDLDALVQAVAAQSGETATVAAIAGNHGLFINAAESTNPIRYFAEAGQRIPLHATAAGRALLSQIPEKQLQALLKRTEYIRYSENTPMSAEAVTALIAEGRERGYYVNSDGYAKDLVGVAIPMRLDGRQLSLLVAGPIYRMSGNHAELAEMLRDCRQRIIGS